MGIDNLADKLRSYCNKQQKAIGDNADPRSAVFNEAYYGLLAASNALHTLKKAGMSVYPELTDGADLLYRFVAPRINELGQNAEIEQKEAITSAWLDIQADLCDLASVVTAADRRGYTLYEK